MNGANTQLVFDSALSEISIIASENVVVQRLSSIILHKWVMKSGTQKPSQGLAEKSVCKSDWSK